MLFQDHSQPRRRLSGLPQGGIFVTWNWEKNALRAAVEDLGVLVVEKLDMSRSRKSSLSWAVSKEPWPTGRGRGFSLCAPVRARPEPRTPLRVLSTRTELCWESTEMLGAGAAPHLRLRVGIVEPGDGSGQTSSHLPVPEERFQKRENAL